MVVTLQILVTSKLCDEFTIKLKFSSIKAFFSLDCLFDFDAIQESRFQGAQTHISGCIKWSHGHSLIFTDSVRQVNFPRCPVDRAEFQSD